MQLGNSAARQVKLRDDSSLGDQTPEKSQGTVDAFALVVRRDRETLNKGVRGTRRAIYGAASLIRERAYHPPAVGGVAAAVDEPRARETADGGSSRLALHALPAGEYAYGGWPVYMQVLE